LPRELAALLRSYDKFLQSLHAHALFRHQAGSRRAWTIVEGLRCVLPVTGHRFGASKKIPGTGRIEEADLTHQPPRISKKGRDC